MPEPHISAHALVRALERIPGIATEDQARKALTSPTVLKAIEFGAHYVRLGTGQHVVIRGGNVVTVLPKEAPLWRLDYFAGRYAGQRGEIEL